MFTVTITLPCSARMWSQQMNTTVKLNLTYVDRTTWTTDDWKVARDARRHGLTVSES